MRISVIGCALVLLLLSSACARRKRTQVPVATTIQTVETGIASWYGHPYHGRKAANGETYDMEKMTAAHRTLPFGTWVNVTSLSNGKEVTVRITDRGPFIDGRVIDLSRAAARAIDMIGPGTAKVRVEVTSAPSLPPDELSYYSVQVGSFRERSRAETVRREMEKRHGVANIIQRAGDPPMWRVLVGREDTIDAAGALAERLKAETRSAYVVRVDASE